MKPSTQFYLMRIALVAALGGLLFGYDFVVIGGAKPFYEAYFGIGDNDSLKGFCMSSAIFGCLVGSLISGALSDKFGRKNLLLFSAFLFALTSLGTAVSNTLTLFNVFRVIGGIGIGLASNLSPMYIAEISPAKDRGRFVSINQLTIVIGILLAQIINLIIAKTFGVTNEVGVNLAESWNGLYGWRYMFASMLIPSLLFLFLLFSVPESPRWLVKNGNVELAKTILSRFLSQKQLEDELSQIQNTISNEEVGCVRFSDLFQKGVFKLLILGIILAIIQQWCGINIIFNYAQEVFKASGYEIGDMFFNIVVTGAVNLIFTIVAMFLIDKWGRKLLLQLGLLGLASSYIALGFCFYTEILGILPIFFIMLAISTFALTLGPAVWVVISEIFPNKIRGTSMGICVFFLWVGCATLTYTFPILNSNLGTFGVFWLYATICIVSFFYISFALFETKGKTLEEIERETSTR